MEWLCSKTPVGSSNVAELEILMRVWLEVCSSSIKEKFQDEFSLLLLIHDPLVILSIFFFNIIFFLEQDGATLLQNTEQKRMLDVVHQLLLEEEGATRIVTLMVKKMTA